jgi:uncharacterized protein (DUF488 family)
VRRWVAKAIEATRRAVPPLRALPALRAMRFELPKVPAALWTIGHSTLPVDTFIAHLRAHAVRHLVDVRRHAGSRRHPQFNPEALDASLAAAGVRYVALPDLGGRRKVRPDSPNTAWRNASFRGYADYMATAEFATALGRLAELAADAPTAVMCAESLWWRCHRSLIADAFKAAGSVVWHIGSDGRGSEHPFTGAARIVHGELSYGDPLLC